MVFAQAKWLALSFHLMELKKWNAKLELHMGWICRFPCIHNSCTRMQRWIPVSLHNWHHFWNGCLHPLPKATYFHWVSLLIMKQKRSRKFVVCMLSHSDYSCICWPSLHIQIKGERDVFIIKEEQSSSMPSKCTSFMQGWLYTQRGTSQMLQVTWLSYLVVVLLEQCTEGGSEQVMLLLRSWRTAMGEVSVSFSILPPWNDLIDAIQHEQLNMKAGDALTACRSRDY